MERKVSRSAVDLRLYQGAMACESLAGVKVAVVGAGAWGTAIASLLAARAETSIWAHEAEVVEAINERHENGVYLAGHPLHPALRASSEVGQVLADAEVVLVAVPSQHFRRVLEAAAPAVGGEVPVLSLAKGVEEGSLLRMSQVVAEVLVGHSPRRIGVLSGPNIANEIAAGQPAATVVAAADPSVAAELQQLLVNDRFRVYTNADVVGCEVGGAVKNVIALAAGMATGLGFGQNVLAALVTRGLAELARLGVALGGQPLTFLGLAGIGDLVVTCHSPDSRNRRVGEALGGGERLADVVASMRAVAEGVRSCPAVLGLGERAGVELPICEQVGEVLAGRVSVPEAVAALLGREPKAELEGIA
jgi:glycerol-3-phosphate dehydrogenase (NAD(P)+)